MKYFKHETSDRNKLAQKIIRGKFGAEGYGIYCALLEVIAEEIDKDNQEDWGYVNKMHTVETLADECATTPDRLHEFLLFCDEKEIFEKRNGRLYSLLVLDRLDDYTVRLRSRSVVTTESQRSNSVLIEQNRKEQNRTEQKRIKFGETKKSASPEDNKIEIQSILGVDTGTILGRHDGNSGISKDWQEKAFRFAQHLGISLSDASNKSRWLKFFRDNKSSKVDGTLSYLSDYQPFQALEGDENRMKYFFAVYYDRSK